MGLIRFFQQLFVILFVVERQLIPAVERDLPVAVAVQGFLLQEQLVKTQGFFDVLGTDIGGSQFYGGTSQTIFVGNGRQGESRPTPYLFRKIRFSTRQTATAIAVAIPESWMLRYQGADIAA